MRPTSKRLRSFLGFAAPLAIKTFVGAGLAFVLAAPAPRSEIDLMLPGNVRLEWIPYPIEGKTVADIRRSLRENGPRDSANISRWALTKWRIAWDLPKDKSNVPDYASATVRTNITVALPTWQATPGSRVSVTAWNHLLVRMVSHEWDHVRHAVRATRDLEDALRSLPAGTSLEDAGRIVSRSVAELRKLDRAYDQATGSGALQGIEVRGLE